jgi:hypothetical protein
MAESKTRPTTVTVADQGPGTLDGHPIETYSVTIGSGDDQTEVIVRAARDLKMLVIGYEKSSGGLPFSYRLKNITLDPPEGLFAIPTGYKQAKN